MKKIIAKYSPPELSIRNVWAGLYGGHYDVIVFFKERPNLKIDFPLLENANLIVGAMYLCDFVELYPGVDLSAYTQPNGRPLSTEVEDTFQMTLEAYWEDTHEARSKKYHFEIKQFLTRVDGWQD